ncbi:hypothetical protein ACSLBF_16570 [Pseudoalteromonas sp. T1lg65]|uniref:hypothetical protein n=1 Tax=Pseudoalteromonas sp. T1lg65 TaxID=2077101 RepID=UPI003F78F38B
MKLLPSITFLLLLFSNSVLASFGGGTWTFQQETERCITMQGRGYFNECLQRGYSYETLETSSSTSFGDITFLTDTIKIGGTVVFQGAYKIQFICSECNYSDANSNFRLAFKEAALTTAFSTRARSRNGSQVNEQPQNNNGGSFSQDFKNFGDGLKSFSEAFRGWFKDEVKNESRMVVVKSPHGVIIISYNAQTGTHKIVADLRNSKRNADGSISFTANISTSESGQYLQTLRDVFGADVFERGGCRLTYTGSGDRYTVDTTCW